jgi:peptidoglycan/xylan/chitin deacetylase (PgdA/CDA1 family)
MDRARRAADRILAWRGLTTAARRVSRRRLRILAYHGVFDVDAFRRQMSILATDYEPVSVADVTAALRDNEPLPDYSAWVTFDDGDASVVENALPILKEAQITATMFVCPGLIDTTTPFWWDIVASALNLGEFWDLDGRRYGKDDGTALVRRLKGLEDDHRRGIVATLADTIVERTGRLLQRRQLTTAQLEEFLSNGGSVGNHTWDHPCLDRVDSATLEVQILKAHEWLENRVGEPVRLFAYPNGDYTPEAEHVLREMGYHVGALFDHRLGVVGGNPLSLSRLRVNDSTSPARFAAILAGVHPALHRMRPGSR